MNETDALNDMAGTVAAPRAAEPVAGEQADSGHSHESACLNCGTVLVGNHCHGCGQPAHVHKTLGAFFHDLLHGVFHFEGRIWRTLPLLVLRPGKLTREYIDGRRTSYVSPIALFLFCVFLLFTTFNTLGTDSGVNVNVAVDDQVSATDAPRFSTASNVAWINDAVNKATANPNLALYKVQTYSYKLSWALIPISVPFLWLLFPFSRRFGIYDHTVFVTYSLCFMTFLAIILQLWGQLGLPGLTIVGLFAPPLHMYHHLRGTYGLTRKGALWRTTLLSMFAFAALMLFAVLILVEAGT